MSRVIAAAFDPASRAGHRHRFHRAPDCSRHAFGARPECGPGGRTGVRARPPSASKRRISLPQRPLQSVDGETTTNLEALIALDWANFSYDFPKTDIEVSSILIVGLTDWGRYRVDLLVRFDRELFNGFHLVIKGFYNFDSRPPTEGASKDDYQVALALGYKF